MMAVRMSMVSIGLVWSVERGNMNFAKKRRKKFEKGIDKRWLV